MREFVSSIRKLCFLITILSPSLPCSNSLKSQQLLAYYIQGVSAAVGNGKDISAIAENRCS
ncbi:hypothetical protein ACLOJK_030223 [Asimina triloba]